MRRPVTCSTILMTPPGDEPVELPQVLAALAARAEGS
jgi:hypothetical protein